jgi:FSR family fosmidomycin resistance protein-like MFS transporter
VNAPVQSENVGAHDAEATVFAVLIAISISHALNDTIQSLLMSIYPMLRDSFALSYAQVGLITFMFLGTASVLQPVVGAITDRRPMPYSLPLGMAASFAGLVILSQAPSFGFILLAAALIGVGSAIFHPEASRVARLASGGRFGFAQSVFQVGGNFGGAIGPLLAAALIVPYGQGSLLWFSGLALLALAVLWGVAGWYRRTHFTAARKVTVRPRRAEGVSQARAVVSIVVLLLLIFSKFFYLESFRSYYTFYLIDTFGVDIQSAQVLLFVQLFAIVVGTLIGGPIGDRFGRKIVIWVSILGVLPLTLLLPHVGLVATVILTVPIGIILASAFPAIIVYAQELLPGRIGMVSGLFFGVAFGIGGISAAALGVLADWTSIEFVYRVCAFLPAIGLLTVFLPNIEGPPRRR